LAISIDGSSSVAVKAFDLRTMHVYPEFQSLNAKLTNVGGSHDIITFRSNALENTEKQASAVESGGPSTEEHSIGSNGDIITNSEGSANSKATAARDAPEKKSTAGDPPAKDPPSRVSDELVTGFMELWQGGNHAFGIRRPAGRRRETDGKNKDDYQTLKRAPTKADFRRHLEGETGIGIVPIDRTGRCAWGAIDIDDYAIDHQEIVQRCHDQDLPLVATRSKSGGLHLELFIDSPVQASHVRELLQQCANWLGIDQLDPEIFPKQDEIKETDTGNFLNLPFFGGEWSVLYAYDPVPGNGTLSPAEYVKLARDQRLRCSELKEIRPAKPPLPQLVPQNPMAQQRTTNEQARVSDAARLTGEIFEGARNGTLMSMVGKMLHAGFPHEAIEEAIRITNQHSCVPPLDDKELESTVLKSIYRYEKGKITPTECQPMGSLLDCVFSTPDLLKLEVPAREDIVEPFIKKPDPRSREDLAGRSAVSGRREGAPVLWCL
jgi:hypothetical protein